MDTRQDFLTCKVKQLEKTIHIHIVTTGGYWPGDISIYLNKPLLTNEKTGTVALFISQPHTWNYNRTGLILELQKYIELDSFGTWNHNKDIPESEKETTYGERQMAKIKVMRRYKFCISFENAIDQVQKFYHLLTHFQYIYHLFKDWVSEKFWQCVAAGSLPIYYGAPNIHDYFPVKHSFINAKSFTDMKELAKYLNYLDKNNTAYDEYFNWKYKPLPQKLFDLQTISFRWNLCRLCDVYYHWKLYPKLNKVKFLDDTSVWRS